MVKLKKKAPIKDDVSPLNLLGVNQSRNVVVESLWLSINFHDSMAPVVVHSLCHGTGNGSAHGCSSLQHRQAVSLSLQVSFTTIEIINTWQLLSKSFIVLVYGVAKIAVENDLAALLLAGP